MFIPSQFANINRDILEQLRQNFVITDWERLGMDKSEFEPYFTVRITADANSIHFFWTSDKYDKFATEWLKENFPNGLPSILDGYMYRISWMPSYTLNSDDPCNTYAKYSETLKTCWQPTLTALSNDENQFPWFFVWNADKHSWVKGPSFISPMWQEKHGMDTFNKQISNETFSSFSWIDFMYRTKNLFPCWWDLT